ncbi:hypothetical protein ABPG74_008674 [Tetrahymena malaccensis]
MMKHSQEELSDSTDVETLPEKKQLKIGYMVNPDPVFFNELDYKLIDELKELGAEIVMINFDDIYFKFTSEKIELYFKSQPLQLDGFMSYGYMSPEHMTDYVEMVKIFEQMGIVCLYNHKEIEVFSNKLQQAVHFAKAKVPIPNTFNAYSVKSTKDYYYTQLGQKAVIKQQTDYGGDGIKLSKHPDEGITQFSKLKWINQKSISQELVPDVWGQSVRVLFIQGKPFACAQYNDKSGDFRSNVSYHENFSLPSFMDNPKLNQYYEVAQKAVHSVSSDIMIAGVDLVDSQSKGIIVLEVNIWPDMYDIQESTKKPVFKSLVSSFYERVQNKVNHVNQLSPNILPKWIGGIQNDVPLLNQKQQIVEQKI